MPEKPISERIEDALHHAKTPLSVDDLCVAVLGRKGARERNVVQVNLHRLDARGVLIKHPRTYSLKGRAPP